MEKTTMIEKQLETAEAQQYVRQILQHVINPKKHHTPYVDFGETLNYEVVEKTTVTGKTNKIKVPLVYNCVVERLLKMTQGTMARVDNMVFAKPDIRGADIKPLNTVAEFLGRLGVINKCAMDWSNAQGMMKPAEAFSEVSLRLPKYRGIETAPHFPLMPDFYYNYPELPEPDFQALSDFLGMFCAATEEDTYLILAMFLTALWGGAVGQRPAFIITSQDGRGSGKTTLGEMLALLLGQEAISGSTKDDMNNLKTRLLSPMGMMSRVVLFDNEVGKVQNNELAGMMTARSISGRRLYSGEGRRSNTMLWIITLNTPTVDQDLASRGIVINIKKPEYSKDWQFKIHSLIRDKRWNIISALVSMLQSDYTLNNVCTRWGAWENEVLAKVRKFYENVTGLQAIIKERQYVVDDDADEVELIRDSFLELIAYNKVDTRISQVFIKNTIAAIIYKTATGSNCKKNTALHSLKEIIRTNGIKELTEYRTRSGRGFLWSSEDVADEDDNIVTAEWYNQGNG